MPFDPSGLGENLGIDPSDLEQDPALAYRVAGVMQDPNAGFAGAAPTAGASMPAIDPATASALMPDKPVGLADLGILALPAIVGALGKFGGGGTKPGGALGAIMGAGLGAQQVQKERAAEFAREKYTEQAKLAREKARVDAAYRTEMLDHARAQSDLWRAQAGAVTDKSAQLKLMAPELRKTAATVYKHGGYSEEEAAALAGSLPPDELMKVVAQGTKAAQENDRFEKIGEPRILDDGTTVQVMASVKNPRNTMLVALQGKAAKTEAQQERDAERTKVREERDADRTTAREESRMIQAHNEYDRQRVKYEADHPTYAPETYKTLGTKPPAEFPEFSDWYEKRKAEEAALKGSSETMVGKPAGLITPGNIDIMHRPNVENPDGSHSSVRSMSFQETPDGPEILVPTVSEDGRIMTNEEAIAQYKKTGRHLGIFDTPDSATAYAKKLHEQQAALGESRARAKAASPTPATHIVRLKDGREVRATLGADGQYYPIE